MKCGALFADQGSGRGGSFLQAGAAAAGRPQRCGHHAGPGLQGVSQTRAGNNYTYKTLRAPNITAGWTMCRKLFTSNDSVIIEYIGY